jgi:hypothetical protein
MIKLTDKELLADALILEKDKEIADLKALISFERDINAGREDQLEQDIKHLRGVIDERGDLIVIAEQRKEIAELKFDLELFMDLCDKKDEWLEVQRNEIAELKAEIENQYELSAFKWSLE